MKEVKKHIILKNNFDLGLNMNFIIELLTFLKSQKKLWLAPLIAILIMLGGLLIIAQGNVIAPFVYTLF